MIVLLGLNGFNYLTVSQIRSIFYPSDQVFEHISSLMRGENRLLEAYFDMKANYYLNNSTGLTASFFDRVQVHLNQSAKEWNTYANDLSTVLKNDDPSF